MPYTTYDNVPYVTCADTTGWRSFLRSGTSVGLSAAIFGDSRATYSYELPKHLNLALARRYRNAGITQLMSCVSEANQTWASAKFTGLESRIPATRRLPVHSDNRVLALADGDQIWCEANPIWASSARAGKPIFDASAGVYVDVFAATNASSGNLVVESRPYTAFASGAAINQGSLAASEGVIGTLTGLQSGTFSIQSATYTAPASGTAARRYPQVYLYSSAAGVKVDLFGVRMRSIARPGGMAVNSYAVPGWNSASLVENYPLCGPTLAGIDCDVVFVSFGAGDSSASRTAAQFEASIQTNVIDFIRVHSPSMRFILSAPPYLTGSLTNYNQYASALANIAAADPLCLAVNTNRLMAEGNWQDSQTDGASAEGNPTLHLIDGVHETPVGTQNAAEVMIDVIFDTLGVDTPTTFRRSVPRAS